MVQYGQENMGANFVHYNHQFLAPSTNLDDNGNLNSSHLSPLMTQQPLSHGRSMAAQSTHQQAIPMQMGLTLDMNGYQPQSMPEMHYRGPGQSAHGLSSSTSSIMVLAEDVTDGRGMVHTVNRAYPTRFEARAPPTPSKLQGWGVGEQQVDIGFAVPPTPLMEETMIPIDNNGWESQEPARRSARAVIANMTEHERLERRREQNRVSQAKLRKTRDALYEKACLEKTELQESYDVLRGMYNQAAAELRYFREKELRRYNAKREKAGLVLYSTFEQLVNGEKDLTLERQELQRKMDEEQTQAQRLEEVAQNQPKRVEFEQRRSSDEHSHSGVSEQMQQAPGSSGTDYSDTSVPVSQSTVTGLRSDQDVSPFAYNLSVNQNPSRRAMPYSSMPKASVKTRKNASAKTAKKSTSFSKGRPVSQQSTDAGTSDLANRLQVMSVPTSDYNQHLDIQMDVMSGSSDVVSYFAPQAPTSGNFTR